MDCASTVSNCNGSLKPDWLFSLLGSDNRCAIHNKVFSSGMECGLEQRKRELGIEWSMIH